MDGRLARLTDKVRHFLKLDRIAPGPRRVLVGVTGGTLLLVGVAMILLPGPALIVIPVALALLATEFMWARRYLHKAENLFKSAKQAITGK
jgi:tellurite resistance protein TerC